MNRQQALFRDRAINDTEFRAAAEECRRLAARTTDPVEKQELQRIADEWLWLAQTE
jgi:hypothetical protein